MLPGIKQSPSGQSVPGIENGPVWLVGSRRSLASGPTCADRETQLSKKPLVGPPWWELGQVKLFPGQNV